MRYLTLAEALVIAETVTGIDGATVTRSSRIELLDSAIHAPQGGFGDVEFYPEFVDKAAVLTVRIAEPPPARRKQATRMGGAANVLCPKRLQARIR